VSLSRAVHVVFSLSPNINICNFFTKRPPRYFSGFFVTLQQVVQQLGGTLLKDSVANELGNPGNDMDTQRNLLGLRVGFEEVSGVLGKPEEDGCSKEL
jgi:hypothetical protein